MTPTLDAALLCSCLYSILIYSILFYSILFYSTRAGLPEESVQLFIEQQIAAEYNITIFFNVNDALINSGGLSDGSDLVAEEIGIKLPLCSEEISK